MAPNKPRIALNKLKHEIKYYHYDIPEDIIPKDISQMSIDTEAMGLHADRDRLCVVQIYIGNIVYIVHFPRPDYNQSPNLKKLLANDAIAKLMHYAFFDMTMILKYLGILTRNIRCTRTLSRMVRTYSNIHGLKGLCRICLSHDLNKACQTSYWGVDILDHQQQHYAAWDVIPLGPLYEVLKKMAIRENRQGSFLEMMLLLPYAVSLANKGFDIPSLLVHH